jgi:hypothetical protein
MAKDAKIWLADGTMNGASRMPNGVNMIRITDKSFRYTASFNTDLRKKFRKLEQERRATAASNITPEAGLGNSVVSLIARRSIPKA